MAVCPDDSPGRTGQDCTCHILRKCAEPGDWRALPVIDVV